MIDRIRGPHHDKTGDRWIVRWRENGKQRAFSRVAEEPVREKAGQLRQAAHAGRSDEKALELDAPTRKLSCDLARFGEAGYIKQCFAEVHDAMVDAYNRGDTKALKMIKSAGSGMTELFTAAIPFLGFLELELKHEKILDYLENHGHVTRREGAQELVPATPGLAEALGSTAGPFEALGRSPDALPAEGRSTRGKSN